MSLTHRKQENGRNDFKEVEYFLIPSPSALCDDTAT